MNGAAPLTRERVEDALEGVLDPCSIAMGRPMSLVTMGLIGDIAVDGADVAVRLVLTDPMCFIQADLRKAVEDAVLAIAGVAECEVRIDGMTLWTPDRIQEARHRPVLTIRRRSHR